MPVAASCGPRPSSVSSRTACGSRLMPTPSGFSVVGGVDQLRLDADGVQAERGGQARDPGACDQDTHLIAPSTVQDELHTSRMKAAAGLSRARVSGRMYSRWLSCWPLPRRVK